MFDPTNSLETLSLIEQYPDQYTHNNWHCGTSHCFAGFGEVLRDYQNLDVSIEELMEREYDASLDIDRDFFGFSQQVWESINALNNNCILTLRLLITAAIKGDGQYLDFRGADLTNANFSNTNLAYANFSKSNLTNVSFRNANLRGANLENANLAIAVLKSADLTSANLTGANFTGANLARACMLGANLTSVNFTKVNLLHTCTVAANFTSANLTKVNI